MRNQALSNKYRELAQNTATTTRRILVVAPSMSILGGQAVQAERLISKLREETPFEIGFLPINPRLPKPFRFLQGIKYVRTVVTSLLYVVTLLTRVPKYDVIHIFSASYFSFVLAPTPAILISKAFGKRILLNYHSGEAEDHLTRWPSAVATIRMADKLVVPSEYLVRVFARFGLQAQSINNLIELEKFVFRERKHLRPRFLTNRNLESHYGVDCVLRAFAIIQQSHDDAEITVAGDGSQRTSVHSLAKHLRLRNITFTGRVEPELIVGQYDGADIYLNGSRIDNQPLSILEAFACGLPVVTTNAGGIPDMVTDGVTGEVVRQDDYEAMASQALRLLEQPDSAERIACSALDECQKYTWKAVGGDWIELYEALARQGWREGQASNRATTLFGKLSRMSFAEARVRASQQLHKFAELHGWSKRSVFPTDEGLLNEFCGPKHLPALSSCEHLLYYFRNRERPNFFSSFNNQQTTIETLRIHWPDAEKQIVQGADRIVAGRFDLLGYTDLNFGDPPKWLLEPISTKATPLVHWSHIDYLDRDTIGDKKIIWELNRHQYFVKLGQAYWLTSDEKYAECFVKHLESWMDENPPKLGINWASSLEIAFRSIAWLWALYFFKDSHALTPAILTRALKFLLVNARHLETYLSTYFSPNTHLTGEALGLFYLGTLLPEFREAERWRNTGHTILVDQLDHHVRPDGVYFEQSSYYHRYTADFYTHFVILSRLNHQKLEPAVEEKLQLLLDHLMYITRPDGTTPLFGDDDGGRLITLDSKPVNDFRAALANGAALFDRSDYKFVAGEPAEETLWLLGAEGVKEYQNTLPAEPASQSRAFSDGGIHVMRDSWNSNANYLLFDCGPHGVMNGGHAHADALALIVCVKGQSILDDSGTFTYTGSHEERDAFRGSESHNVLLVDGQPSSVPDGPFTWKSTANSKALSWVSVPRFDFVEGQHDGYTRLPDPVVHTRSILFLKNDYWIVRDQVTASEAHQLVLRFHFAPDCKLQASDRAELDGSQVLISRDELSSGLNVVTFAEGVWQREEGWISHCYGNREIAPVLTFSAVSKGNTELITLLLPNAGISGEHARMREVEAIGGRAFEIVRGRYRDVVLLRDPRARRIQTVHLMSDFSWTWSRFSLGSSELPEELVVLDGRSLELDGKEILTSSRPINHLVASRHGNKFRIVTSEGHFDFAFPINDLDSLLVESASTEAD